MTHKLLIDSLADNYIDEHSKAISLPKKVDKYKATIAHLNEKRNLQQTTHYDWGERSKGRAINLLYYAIMEVQQAPYYELIMTIF